MPKYPQSPRASVVSSLLIVAVVSLLSTACQTTPTNLDNTGYNRQLRDVDGYLFESDRRFITMQFTHSDLRGIVDSDSVVAYMSVPWRAHDGLKFGDPGVAFGWSSVAVVFSDMFSKKGDDPGRAVPDEWRENARWLPSESEMLRMTDELSAMPDLSLINQFQPGAGPEVVDYGSLFQPGPAQLEIAGLDPQDRATD